ncbi:hypothetical protein NQK81_13420 [Amycolatopsis roodepoortensis]|uniref:hypothetical protein n=1 Tax=Amycolatopsis roodepoortensis TaxID=700274 RepID=UPI00214CD686|nr:hypothetical protein [Amycolatopsis roodepoortensis]UUV34405.1 hypothetical protein NQK81_13420 [Amycolatopsis roodepoortensis]
MTAVDTGTEDPGRHLSAVPEPGTPAAPKPKPPSRSPYPRNPLLDYRYGPDPEGLCPACRWVKAIDWPTPQQWCPHHVLWHDSTIPKLAQAGDAKGPFLVHASTAPAFARGDRVWFQGKLETIVDERYWGRDGRWRYVAITPRQGTAVDSAESEFTREFRAGWPA